MSTQTRESEKSEKSEDVKIIHLFILDKSWSMSAVINETINGVNEQFKTLREVAKDNDQDQEVCLVLFSWHHSIEHVLWSKPIADAEDLTTKTYVPDGYTALYDAVGCSINQLKKEVLEDLEAKKAAIVVTIFTDGKENNSKEFSDLADLVKILEDIQDTGLWTVNLVGCDLKTFDLARSLKIKAANTMQYSQGSVGTEKAMRGLARSSALYSSNVQSMGIAGAASLDYLSAVEEDDDIKIGSDTEAEDTSLGQTEDSES
tara:strand:- start:6908 stop:7687 length:780 start_codon:yes stop_codon:yes gene_type:complete